MDLNYSVNLVATGAFKDVLSVFLSWKSRRDHEFRLFVIFVNN